MSTDDMTPVGDGDLRVAIEIGNNAQTTARVKAAIAELAEALAEAEDDDVSGFAMQSLRSGAFLFDSRSGGPVVKLGTSSDNKQEPWLKYSGEVIPKLP